MLIKQVSMRNLLENPPCSLIPHAMACMYAETLVYPSTEDRSAVAASRDCINLIPVPRIWLPGPMMRDLHSGTLSTHNLEIAFFVCIYFCLYIQSCAHKYLTTIFHSYSILIIIYSTHKKSESNDVRFPWSMESQNGSQCTRG